MLHLLMTSLTGVSTIALQEAGTPPADAASDIDSGGQQDGPPPTEGGSGGNGEGDGAGDVATAIIDSLTVTVTETDWLGWTILFCGILGGLVIGKISQFILRNVAGRLTSRGWQVRGTIVEDSSGPVAMAVFGVGLSVGLASIKMSGDVQVFAFKCVQFLYIVAIGWFFYNLVDIVDLYLRKLADQSGSKLAVQLVPLVRKALRIFLLILFVLFAAQNVFGANVGAWLAGLGLAGLALSLAAQDSVKNLFGTITILLDRPFAAGDRVIFDSSDGFVEEIGFRSTKLRTFGGHLITVPNMKFIDGVVENVSARPFIRRNMNVTITYDTPPEKTELAVKILRDLLAEPEFAEPFNLEERPPRVYFNDLNADSLNILAIYWFFLDEPNGRDWWAYLDHADRLNRRLLAAFNEAGIDFAFPTQTLHLAGDTKRELAIRLLDHDARGPAPVDAN